MTTTYTYETPNPEDLALAVAHVNDIENGPCNAYVAVEIGENGPEVVRSATDPLLGRVEQVTKWTFSDPDATGADNIVIIVKTCKSGKVDKRYAPLAYHVHHEQDSSDEPTDAARDAPEVFTCDCCGAEHAADELTETADGEQVCEECLDNYYSQCDRCGEWVSTDELEPVYRDEVRQPLEGLWCPSCIEEHAQTCDECGQHFIMTYIDGLYSQAHGCRVNICMNCSDGRYEVCEECGEVVDIDYATFVDDMWYCEACAPDMNEHVHEYGSTYATRFLALDDENANRVCVPYLGIELETDCSGCFSEAAEMLEWCFGSDADLKRDSSIGDGGIEIAAQPQTPAYALSADGPWPHVLERLTRHGATSHDAGTCGLHVHIDRAFLDAPYMACTLDRLFQTHKNEWRIFSRRTPGQIDAWSKFGTIGYEYGLTPKQKREAWDKEKRRFDRYQVVNLSNADTIEIRLWRGTLREKTFRATIEATAALAYLAHDLSETEAEDVELWTWHSLTLHMVNTLKRYRLPYSDLLEYLHERGL